jgi:plasmid maintenance system antidote protein VapI
MTIKELSDLAVISQSHARYILSGKRHASRKLAKRLEEKTGVRAEAWVFPEVFYNPHLTPGIREREQKKAG